MHYWGKVIGAAAGLVTGRPWMAIIGLILGHQFDRGFADRFTKFGPDISSGRLEKLPGQYVKALFQTMGHLAKVDGRVTEDEIRAVRALMNRLGLGPVEVRQAIGWFEAGKVPTLFRLNRRSARFAAKVRARRKGGHCLFGS